MLIFLNDAIFLEFLTMQFFIDFFWILFIVFEKKINIVQCVLAMFWFGWLQICENVGTYFA